VLLVIGKHNELLGYMLIILTLSEKLLSCLLL